MKADGYSGIITVSAIILAVEYADSPYDIWDVLVGFLGVTLAVAYAREPRPPSKVSAVFIALVGSLFSLSAITIMCTVITSFCVDMPQDLVPQGFEGLRGGSAYHRVVRLFLGIRGFGREFSCG
jgi:hypothetical protein